MWENGTTKSRLTNNKPALIIKIAYKVDKKGRIMARPSRRGRELHGVILVDKPLGMSSNDLLQKVKRLFDAKRAGHTGALDPLASGMLPICFGEATKFSQYLLDADKRYRVKAKLGVRTDTSDKEGLVVSTRSVNISQDQLESAVQRFLGVTDQIPSIYSALKYQGRPLYEYARQGISVPIEPRKIEVFEIKLLDWQPELSEVELEIHCSKGTYIRTIIDDLGEDLGCGAHVTELHRLAVGSYPASHMISWYDLLELAQPGFKSARPGIITNEHDEAFLAASDSVKFRLTYELHSIEQAARFERLSPLLLPMDTPAAAFPLINLPAKSAESFRRGLQITLHPASTQSQQVKKTHRSDAFLTVELPPKGFLRVFCEETNLFIGVGELNHQNLLSPRRVVVLEE